MKGNKFVSNCDALFYYKCDKITWNNGKSFMIFVNLTKNKNTARNSKSNDDKYFQYTVTIILNYAKIGRIHRQCQNVSLW